MSLLAFIKNIGIIEAHFKKNNIKYHYSLGIYSDSYYQYKYIVYNAIGYPYDIPADKIDIEIHCKECSTELTFTFYKQNNE